MSGEQTSLLVRATELRWRLSAMLPPLAPEDAAAPVAPPAHPSIGPAEAVITHNEVNDKHGVGVLVTRIFAGTPNVISIRSHNHFGGEQNFGRISICLAHSQGEKSRPRAYAAVLASLQSQDIRRVICMPYYADDVLSALALTDAFGAKLCTYIMDDQNICDSGISDDLLAELLAKSSLRLAISEEMRDAYEAKYKLRFWVVPPVVADELIRSKVPAVVPEIDPNRTAIIGNIWGARWLDLLRKTIKGSGVMVDWYCQDPLRWHKVNEQDLRKDGILIRGGLGEPELAERLQNYSFITLPSGTLDEADDRRAIAQLSLPSKVPFILATSNTPIIVLGSPDTAAAKFVRRHRIGENAIYTTDSFLQAVARVAAPGAQATMRDHAARMAPRFSVMGVRDWIWESLRLGRAGDMRFEELGLDKESNST